VVQYREDSLNIQSMALKISAGFFVARGGLVVTGWSAPAVLVGGGEGEEASSLLLPPCWFDSAVDPRVNRS
jgi:hypothetical protein